MQKEYGIQGEEEDDDDGGGGGIEDVYKRQA